MNRATVILLCAFGFSLSPFVQAKDLFEQASEAFVEGRYQQAADFFSALAETDSSAEVRYNLAICYFKLEQWEQARASFQALNQIDPEEDLVTYNLAITEKKLGNIEVARAHFEALSQSETDASIAQLASRQLIQLSKRSNRLRHKQSDWSVGLKTEFGRYDNLLTPSLEKNTGLGDNLLESRAYFTWQSNRYTTDRWTISGLLYKSNYQETQEYNADYAKLGIRKYTQWADGYVYLGLDVDSSELEGEGYLQNVALEGGMVQRFGDNHYWGAKLRHREVDSLSAEYEPFMGTNHLLKFNLRQGLSEHLSWDLHYQYSQDNREDSSSFLNFRSFSPVRQSVGSALIVQWPAWRLVLDLEYRDSDYQKDNQYFGQPILRKDERLKTKFSLNWQASEAWALSAEYSYIDNESSVDIYNYHQQLLKLGIAWEM